ncbi:MAG: IPTL-CTERM sorting domain-containing protein [Ottowia sp.]|nr:IPTL-CTERM sorting domain-containing protein [Ottowia sp.]
MQNTVVSGALIETFERGPGSIGASGTWNIGNYTASTGSYDAAGVYGGAGRTGYYLGVHTGPINVAVAPGYQYLGFWWSAGDASNIITFYDEHGVQLIRFTTADINALLSGTGTVPTVGGSTYPKASFFGNPNPPGGNTGEPYAYVNLILTNTTSTFGSIKIEGSNFELDNLSIAYPTSPQSNWVPVTTYPMALAAVNDAYATPAGQTVSGNVSTNDATPSVGVTPTYAVVTNVSHGTLTLNSSTGAFSYTPNAGFTGVDTFTYNRCRTDAPTVCSLATVTITVFDAVNDTNSTLAGQTVTGNAASNDAFPVGSTFSGPTSSTNGGTVSMNADGTYSYTPAPGFSGVDTFNYSLCLPSPNQAICDTATVSIGVRPDAVNDTGSTMANTPLSSSVAGNDIGVQPNSTFSKATDPAHGTVTVNADGTYVYTPTAGYTGTDSFTYQVCLPSPNQTICDTATVNVTVFGAVNDQVVTNVGTPVSGNAATNDLGVPANSTYTKATDPAHGTVTMNADGTYTYTPAAGYSGLDSFTYQVCPPSPNQTHCSTATVSINVLAAVNDQAVTTVDTPVSGNVATNDGTVPPGATFSKATDPAHGTVVVNADGTYTYTPSPGYSGADSFTYRLCTADTPPVCTTATVDLFVMKAVDDQLGAVPGARIPGNLASNDTVPPGSTFSGPVSGPSHGTVTVNADGTYTYQSDPGYLGNDSFTYQVCAPAVGAAAPVCTTATVRVLVQQPAPVPTLSQWALMLLAGLMALGAARRRNA